MNAINFFLEKEPELANAKMKVPILNVSQHGGGIPLHVACRHYSSVHVITALLAENFESAHVRDENGELPLSLILRRKPDTVVVKTLLALYPPALVCIYFALGFSDSLRIYLLSISLNSSRNISPLKTGLWPHCVFVGLFHVLERKRY